MASPFSFHCMICFEEFDIDKRYPVVLPCGHTYICNECANRLDKCMECRTPLVEYMPRKNNNNSSNSNAPASSVHGGVAIGRAGTVRGRPGTTSGPFSTTGRGIYNAANANGGSPGPVEPLKIAKRTPLPKNVVLMSLIEATEVAAENVQRQNHQPSMSESPMINPSVLDIEDDEEEKIRASTTLAISDCGTYAVAAKDGLEIFPSRPESLLSPGIGGGNNSDPTEEDVDTLVRFFHIEHKLDLENGTVSRSGSGEGGRVSETAAAADTNYAGDGDDGEEATERVRQQHRVVVPDDLPSPFNEDKKMDDNDADTTLRTKSSGGGTVTPPGRLSWGDRVQIVSTRNGWAKLARGYGYVRAGHNQLVKVGGSVDRSCKLEAMLRQLSAKRKCLREEQKRVDNQFIALMNELQVSLVADEDMTVIAADTFHKNIENDPSAASVSLRNRDAMFDSTFDLSAHEQVNTSNATHDDSHTPLKPRFMERPMTPPGDSSRGLFFCNGSDVLNAVLPMSSTRTQAPALPTTTRSPAIAHELSTALHTSNTDQDGSSSPVNTAQAQYNHSPTNDVENTPTRLLTSVSTPSPSALRAGARAWREMNGRAPSDRVDFRTGMSGHSATFSSSAHSHHYLEKTRSLWAGMSNHTGLSMWKSSSRKPISNYSNASPSIHQPALPAFPASGSGDSRNDAGSVN